MNKECNHCGNVFVSGNWICPKCGSRDVEAQGVVYTTVIDTAKLEPGTIVKVVSSAPQIVEW